MAGPIKGFSTTLLPPKTAQTAWRPPPITIEYVDTESANVQLRLPKGEGGLELFHRRSRQRLADRFEEKMKSLEIPSLMEKARERLEDQVSQVKKRLEDRYGLTKEQQEVDAGNDPKAHGQRMAAFAIRLFDHFLEASKVREDSPGDRPDRASFVQTVRSEVRNSLDETRSALQGLDILSDELSDRLQSTFDHFDARLRAFAEEE
ncbi:MAG: hypothetical protein CMH50_06820 [Myxococcales bacterium]|nr:hypothetical protein [Myxococcales bacterium]